ncbi:hypothetical protein Tco_1108502 [Tanacetum coccineum]
MENQEQNPPQQEQLFVTAKQVGFNLKDIILNTNNEVALLYPEHTNHAFFKCVSDFISKCCLRELFTRSSNMYKEYLAEFWYSAKTLKNSMVSFSVPTTSIYGEVGVNTFRNAIGAHYLPHSREYVAPPSIDIVRPWFETIGEKVIPYTRFLYLLMMHKMKEGYGDGEVTPYPTQVFSVNNWALKPNQPKEPLFTNHMLAICNAAKPVVFKAPKPSSNAERVPQGTKPGAKPRHKKHLTSLKQPSVSSKEEIKGESFKEPTSSKTGHSKKRKVSSLAMDSNPSQPLVSKPVDTGMHKEDHQVTSGPAFLGVTSEARANPQLSSGMSTFNLNKPIYSTSFIILSESISGNDALAISIAEADLGKSSPSNFVPRQKGLETVRTQPTIGKGASSIVKQVKEDEASRTINFKDLDLPKDDHVIIVDDSDKDEDNKVHTTTNVETEDTSVPKSSSPRSSQIQELTNKVPIIQSQKHKLELEKNKAEAEAALLKAQPTFPNVGQLNELLVKSLQTKLSKILFAHDFNNSLPTELKDLPSKFNELTEVVKGLKKQVHELEIELPGDLKEIPTKLEDFTKTVICLASQVAELKTLQWELPTEFLSLPVHVATVQAKLKTLDALSSLLLNVTKALNKFAQVLDSVSSKAVDQSVPSAGQADTMAAEGEKNTNQATISQLFQRRAEKNAKKENLNNQQPKLIPPIITTTTQMQSSSLQSPPKSSSQPEGEHIKKDKGKKAMSSEEAEKKKLKKFNFITKDGRHIHLTEEEINHQKKLEEDAKAKVDKQEGEVRKAELVDLLGPEVVNKYYNDKLQYDRYCNKMLNRRDESRITNCDVLTKKGPITLKVYREDGTSEAILNFKASDRHLGNKRLKSSVQYEDHLPGNVLNEPVLGMIMFNSYHRQDFVTIEDLKDFSNTMLYTVQEIFFRRHQGPGLDDHARTFSSLLLAEVDKRNLNPLKQMRTIEQLRQ